MAHPDRRPVEHISKSELEHETLKKLKAIVRYSAERSHLYRQRFKAMGLDPQSIQVPQDLCKIPFTSKEDLRANSTSNILAVPQADLVRVHMSSGTTGDPIVIGYTREDIETWTELMARSLSTYGVTGRDVVQIAYGYGLFTGGLGFHYGAESLGSLVVPTSTGHTQRQIEIMKRAETTVLCCTPSYALYLGEKASEMGLDIEEDLNLRIGVFGAEPWSERTRERIETHLNLVAFDHYGLTEMGGPGVAAECDERAGLHVWTDHFYPEVIDPETGEVVEHGVRGELVLSTLSREATPLVRFRTGDITSLNYEPCPCGSPFPRIERLRGRTDDMLKVKGTILYPRQVEEAVLGVPGIGNAWEMVLERRPGMMDSVTVRAESDSPGVNKEDLKRRLREKLRRTLYIHVQVRILDPGSLRRFEGKANRVIDRRDF